MQIRTLQCKIQRLKNQTLIEKYQKSIVSPSVTLFEKGIHIERAGSDLYLHKNVKMVATTTKLHFCTEVLVLVEGHIFFSIRYMDPIIKILYHSYTIAATRCTQMLSIRKTAVFNNME